MKKSIFTTGGRKKVTKTKLAVNLSDEANGASAWSTDPKDLPPGFNVGSMSAPYSPTPPESPSSKHESPLQRKKKVKKPYKVVNHSISVPGSVGKETRHFVFTKKSSPPTPLIPSTKESRRLKMEQIHMQRSCSVDALNEIDEKEKIRMSSELKKAPLRRSTSSGVEEDHLNILEPHNESSRKKAITARTTRRIPPNQDHHYEQRKSRGDSLIVLEAQLSHPDSTVFRQHVLHRPKTVEQFLETIQSGSVDVNKVDSVTGDAPIHSIVKMKKKYHTELLFALLINSKAEVNLQNRKKKTALHVALEAGCESCAKILMVFGADINTHDANQFTPMDLVIDNGRLSEIESILYKLQARSGVQQMTEGRKKVPRLYSFAQKLRPPKKGERLSTNDNISEFVKRRGTNVMYRELEININRRMSMSATIGGPDDTLALVLQQREIALYNKTLKKTKQTVTEHGVRGGSRLLFLDGGGIKGLVQLEVLIRIEEQTQCSISDLFDWIVGTSTGGIIALAIVYAKKSLLSLRQLYFMLKDRIFMKHRYGFGYNAETLEEILKDYLDPNMKMSDVTHPKVLIAAVNKATTNLEVHFFNNCFGDDFTDYPIWKVARYTSAAPMMFNEFENYVDGGVICNNPTDCGLTAIQNFCKLQGYKLPIAMVISIGTGIYPAEKMGSVDAQDALFFGKQWLHPSKLIKQTQNLLSLLSNALVESELVAENSRSRCEEQDIPFFRFSPKFDMIISSGETDTEKLLNMVIKTKIYLKEQEKLLQQITNIFHKVAESSQDIDEKQPLATLSEEAEEEAIEVKEGGDQAEAVAVELAEIDENDHNFPQVSDLVVQDKENYTKFCLFRTGSLISSIENEMGIADLDNPNARTKPDYSPEHSENASGENEPSSAKSMNDSNTRLYQPYKAGTEQLDTSKEEYTDYSRETLV